MWKPGQSGNPAGRPRGAAGLARYIREQTGDLHEMIDLAIEMARGRGATPSTTRDRLYAINIVLDRALGKPDQAVAVTADVGPSKRVDLSLLSDAELDQYAALLKKATTPPKVIDAVEVKKELK